LTAATGRRRATLITSLDLSVLLRQPIEIFNIRAGRSRPGLHSQHLTGVRALTQISGVKIKNDQKGSTSLSFVPEEICSGSYTFDVAEEIRSAGAATLLFQALDIPLTYGSGPSESTLRGGTHVA